MQKDQRHDEKGIWKLEWNGLAEGLKNLKSGVSIINARKPTK